MYADYAVYVLILVLERLSSLLSVRMVVVHYAAMFALMLCGVVLFRNLRICVVVILLLCGLARRLFYYFFSHVVIKLFLADVLTCRNVVTVGALM